MSGFVKAQKLFARILPNQKVRISPLESLKIPPVSGARDIRNSYVPFSKRYLIRELLQDVDVLHPTQRTQFEQLATFVDKHIEKQYRLLTAELSLLLRPFTTASTISDEYPELSVMSAVEQAEGPKAKHIERLDQEYWLLRRISELAMVNGFAETSLEAVQAACRPRAPTGTKIKTYVHAFDYDVIRFWTRGLHPHDMFPYKSSFGASLVRRRFSDSLIVHLFQRMSRAMLSRLAGVIPKGELCYSRVLMAVRTKDSSKLCLRLFKNVPVSHTSRDNLYADGLVDLLPEHRFAPLSATAQMLLYAAGIYSIVALPAALFAVTSQDPFYCHPVSALGVSVAAASLIALRYWYQRAHWCDRHRQLLGSCDFSSETSALTNFLGLAQAQQLKAALLSYALLLQPTETSMPLSLAQLEVRAESWVAQRLGPQAHVGLPARSREEQPKTGTRSFTGGSGPNFDLSFNLSKTVQLLRHLDLVRGPIDALQAVHLHKATSLMAGQEELEDMSRLWLLELQSEEEELDRN